MNSINLRIKELVDYFSSGNNSDFGNKVGINEANIRNYINKTEPKFNVLEKIATKFDISYEWLLTGKGEMLKKPEELEKPEQLEEFKEPEKPKEVSYETPVVRTTDADINKIIIPFLEKSLKEKDERIEMLRELIKTKDKLIEVMERAIKNLNNNNNKKMTG